MRFINSLFWQLYLSILGALILIVVLFFAMMEYINHQTGVEDFHRDIQLAAQPILSDWRETQQINLELMKQVGDASFFHISVLDADAFHERLVDYEWVRTIKNIELYQRVQDDLSLAAQVLPSTLTSTLPNNDAWLIIEDIDVDPDAGDISDHIRQSFEDELHEESQQETILQLLAIGLLLLIGTVLMVLVQRIRRHIDGLISVSNDWAKGELSVKANVNAPAPLDQLAHGLNRMADDLNHTLVEQQVMAHAISHELRTPLSKLQLALSLMVRKHASLQDELLASDLQRYIDELESLVSQMLTFAKVNYKKERSSVETVDASKFIGERVNELKILNAEKEINLTCESNIKIEGNLFNLQIALDNILKNALKYANQCVQITVIREPLQHQIGITIEDDGPGIPLENLKTILMPFARVDESRNRESGGFGLGLAIVDAIIGQHEGEIVLAESPLGGLSFSIRLPLR